MIKTVKKITSWSYSRYAKYNDCPAAAKYKFIDKLQEPGSAAMERGNAIHKMAEDYTKGATKKLPPELTKFAEEFKELKGSKPIVEQTWAFTKEWAETVWNDWQGCWLRIKTDAACLDGDTLYVIDHKTGKQREGYGEQMTLYGVGGFLKYPHIKKVVAQLWFLDSGGVVPAEYKVSEFKAMQKDWEKKVQPMLNDTRFAPKPGNACRFCHFKKANGGPCKF